MRFRALVLALLALGISVSSLESAPPLQSGTSVVVFLDTSGNLPEPDPGPPTDMMVFTGGRSFLAQLPGCSDTPLALQDAVLIDRDGPRASRHAKVFLAPGQDAVPAGTRLKNFASGIACLSDGIVYKKYTGVVE